MMIILGRCSRLAYQLFQLIVQLQLLVVQSIDDARAIGRACAAAIHFQIGDLRIFLAQLAEQFLLPGERREAKDERGDRREDAY